MTKWNWTPKAYRLRDNLIALGCLAASSGMIVWMFVLATN
jgi:hypothetical protein